ncbi:MAG: methyl-accepting chemotaxis protein [Sinimarinibacterium flocculans]|uniref:Twitching motility protein PilJ n=1 Tax=Sinimarinibacterium flocculans TaxID=985250 RepID=A0A318E789_9GAMM|nr:methyl-accepting chemotaxis protein [Sinimarinibacterium flocculans]PXV66228.1 twitching motility protein PilJ [Sinimarinibacterium flocculans]
MAEPRRARGTRRELATLIVAVLLIAVAMAGFYFIQRVDTRDETWVELSRQISADVGEVVDVGETATRGLTPDFLTLVARVEDLDLNVEALAQGDDIAGIEPAPPAVQSEVAEVAAAWEQMKGTVQTVLDGEQAWRLSASSVSTIRSAIHADEGDDLFKIYERIAERLGGRAGQNPAIAPLVRLERISSEATRVLGAGRDALATVQALDAEVRTFQQTNARLAGDAEVGALAREAAERFEAVASASELLLENAEAVDQLQIAAGQLQGLATNVIATAKALEQRLLDTRVRQVILPIVVAVSGGLAIVLLVIFIVITVRTTRTRLQNAEERDAKQQQAILSLLDEITNLADGDLTVDVTVTEDFTGAIADSINYTVQNMRNLVGTINNTSVEIATAASNTKETALRMNEASERQAKEITAVANTITATSQSMQQVAASAEQLAQQAQQSVRVAHNGADTVNRTILGMTALREQIQDTSKRIKRLGESSQEIGNIIEFINDIAEQTNTLALNASIQAAMAGDAGRGFAVVADEVQRLAERAANATRQVETLVKTIQADTNEAIVSMERSTQNVVVGAKSAEEAGQALTKIESASQELAKLITNISSSARKESAQATNIAGTMQVIRDIAVQTSGSANRTASAVEELNVLSQKLRESVAGFKLPEDTLA